MQLQPPAVMQNPSDSDPLLHNQEEEEEDESPGSSGEIKNEEEDVEAGLLPCCRICLESDSDPEDELISPCMCKGTQQFVHRSCLDHWRSVKEGFAFSHCTTCKAQFHLRVESFEDNSWRKIKFRLFVARDVFLVFLAVQTVIAAIGGFSYIMDKDGSFRNSFDDGWDRILSRHPIPFYYCIGVLAFFVLMGFLASYCIAPPSIAMTPEWLAVKTVVMDGASWIAFLHQWRLALPLWLFSLSSLQFLV